jgi:triacylglycerol lipase
MYYPPNFDPQKAIELGRLVKQAYQCFENFKQGTPWTLQGDYSLVSEISYHTVMSFDPTNEEAGLTAIDTEIAKEALSFSAEGFLGKDIPMGFVARSADKKEVFLVFRGTVSALEWLFDIDIKVQTYGQPDWGSVTDGFLKIYNRCRESFLNNLITLAPANPQLYISGHSLGGALSVLALPDVIRSTPFKQPIVYNFGCPRVGDNTFVTAYNALPSQQTFRVVNTSDLVTSIPLPIQIPLVPSGNYSHVNTPVDFTIQENNLGLNHSMDTYIAALGG